MESIQYTAKTLVELLRWRADNQPDKLGFMYLEDGEREGGSFTYNELDIRAKAIAAKLQSLKLEGERALLIYESGPDYMDSFFGCLYAGVISVPLHLPGKNKSLSRISAIAKDSGAKIILATEEIKAELENEFGEDEVLKGLDWITTENISNEQKVGFIMPDIKPETLAYLQYTSGSTGIPKGVMVNHRNLIHNVNIINKSHPHTDKSVMVTWLPIHHDMGLIYGMLLPFCCGYPCYFMTPQAFVQKPYRWLNAISKYKGSHNAAPNFAFELCVNKITQEQKNTLDLSSWTTAMNAAEPVRAETIRRFAEYFKECGFELKYFSPGYGLAEGTLILSTTFLDDEPVMKRFADSEIEKNNVAVDADENDVDSKIHVGHSHSIEDTRIAIVNPTTLIECTDGVVGEVWASGISIAQGYWQREDATKETFKAHIADTNEGPFMRTGDLGFIKDKELYITGRHKDLIIIRGQNHYPQDIEYTVEASHPSLRLGCVAAFSMEDNGEEHLAIVQEVQKNFVKDFDPDEVVKAIRRSVSEEHDLQVSSVTLIKPGTVPKTSSGKIQRKECLAGVQNNSLEVIAQWNNKGLSDLRISDPQTDKKIEVIADKIQPKKFILSENNLREWLVNRLSEMMQIKKESIDTTEPFAAYGMDSLKAVELSGDLETLLEKELPATLVYDYPSIDSLSNFLAGDKSFGESKIESKQNNLSHKNSANEPIAIVGIGLRFPEANNVSEFWNNLITGKDSIREIPQGRWSKELLKNSTITFGGFVDDVDKFDPVFFGISPREAIQIDPQQRFTLEVAYEAMEDAGINPETLAGTNTGVFIGICTYDYSRFSSGKKELFDVYTGTGTSLSIAANRLSYVFDFRGPSIAIDTACSSSLVALHTACQSLRSGQSDVALAGGVNLLLAPDWNVVFTEADMLASDGRCKTFDASADGYVRSEGCGIIVLKKLSDAVRDGDRIYSVIKGSAINQDGRSNGLTAPNGPSQEEVIKTALREADVKANEISYLETHGTGTPLGDPIEVNSIAKVLTKDRSEENICYIGSVKTNIGHLEAAAGIAGVIKTSLALYNKEIPKHLNYKALNPEILIDGKPVKVADRNIIWEGQIRNAGVSSFGFGGTNAHVILQSAPAVKNSASKTKPLNIFTLSAKNENALNESVKKHLELIKTDDTLKLEDICFSANEGRASHNHRLAVICADKNELKTELGKFLDGENSQRTFTSTVRINHFPKTAFLFPGQGAQFIGMGKELYDTQPLFRTIINKCDEILRDHLEKPLLEVLFYEKDEKLNPINETTYTQPALFAIEYALAKLWMSWGIKPDVMMGHSAGEYVAACLAGVFSLEDGLKLVTERGRLMQTLTGDGEMYTVFTDENSVKKYITGYEDSVSVASINSPLKTVISGEKNSLAKIISRVDSDKIEFKKINVSIASHSPLMNPMISEFRKVCNEVQYSDASIPVVSNITGEVVTDKISNAEYWCDHILSTVRFSEGIKASVNYGCEFFIDLGPKPTSISMAQETISDPTIHWIPSIKYNFSIWETMLQGLAALYVNGVSVDWKGFDKDFAHKKISLPSYPFQKQRYWIDDLNKKDHESGLNFTQRNNESHPLLGSMIVTASDNEFIFNSRIESNNPEYLKDHLVFGKVVLPGAAYIEIAAAAFKEITDKTKFSVTDISFRHAMVIEEGSFRNVQTILAKKENGNYEFRIFSLSDSDWTLHSSGNISDATQDTASPELDKLKNKFTQTFSPAKVYENAKETGVEYGKEFQAIRELFTNDDSALSRLKLTGNAQDKYLIHPVILDAAFQTALSILIKDKDKAFIPVGAESFNFYSDAGDEVWSLVEIKEGNTNSNIHSADIKIFTKEGKNVADISDLKLKEVSREEFTESMNNINDWFYEVKWEASDEKTALDSDVGEVYNEVKTVLPKLISANNLQEYKNEIERIEKVALSYIVSALRNSGFDFEKQESFGADEIAVKFNIAKSQRKLFDRLLHILSENGILKFSDGKFTVKDHQPEVALVDIPFTSATAELELLRRCGEHLNNVLTGKQDAIQLLFPNGDFTLAEKLYKDSPGFVVMNEAIKNAVVNILSTGNSDHKIRILEIGAGTGSTASYILPLLKNNASYTFTDISPAFFIKAKEKFNEFDNVEYKVLDIEKDPSSQNFDTHSYDIIIASNVVHATKDLSASVKNIKSLLNRNGIIILNEVTEKKNWIDLTFGLTDGWWRFEDDGLRKNYPLLGNAEWKKFLESESFQAEVASPSDQKNSLSAQSLIIAQQRTEIDSSRSHLVIFNAGKNDPPLSAYLKVSDVDHTLINDDNSFKKISGNKFSMNFNEAEDHKKLLTELELKSDSVHIVYIATDRNSIRTKSISDDSIEPCVHILNIIKSISGEPKFEGSTLSIITFETQKVTASDTSEGLIHSPLWGMGKVISMEHPGLKCKLIDTDRNSEWKNIFSQINSESDEDQTAFRNNKKYLARLQRMNFGRRKNFTVDEKGTYLITGGLSGLGILSAKWLADQGAKHLVLTGRRGMVEESQKYLDEIEAAGVDVKVVKADVTNKEELGKIIKDISKTKFPLKGIIHSVGVLDDGIILNQSREKFGNVMNPKVAGAWYLHELTKKLDLEMFIMYSSVASMLGSAGQVNHSAANAFLDALAHYRASENLNAQCINWGVWSEIGSAAAKGADKKEKIEGILSINPSEGIRALNKAVRLNVNEVGVVPIDWEKYSAVYNKPYTSKLLSSIVKSAETTQSGAKKSKDDFITQLQNSKEEEHGDLLIKYFQDLISRIMGLEPEDFEPEQPLNTMGLDSLMAIELKNKVNIELGVDLNLVRYMEETNIVQLANELKEQLPKILKRGTDAAETNGKHEITDEDKARDLLANLEDLSDEELDRLLNETK